ncbi:MAG: cytochrome c oxidase subunit II [Planctomycetales bacterium]|nr:cytochrome c oxidase subunit II [Planctomycetales bacterium]
MNKLWSLLFLAVPVGSVGLFIWAPANGHWWPKPLSSYGADIDYFYYLITVITTIMFLVTELLLTWAVFKYRSDTPGRASHWHDNKKLEITWTAATALILLWLGVYQIGIWKDVKFPGRFPKDAQLVAEVTGRQFEWRFRYPGADGKLHTVDDVQTVNELHVPVGVPVKILLKAQDVLHSFFLPNFRVKQDAVPGVEIPVWWKSTEEGVFDLVCAELCGWGHYKMKGRITVESPEKFQAWLTKTWQEQEATR